MARQRFLVDTCCSLPHFSLCFCYKAFTLALVHPTLSPGNYFKETTSGPEGSCCHDVEALLNPLLHPVDSPRHALRSWRYSRPSITHTWSSPLDFVVCCHALSLPLLTADLQQLPHRLIASAGPAGCTAFKMQSKSVQVQVIYNQRRAHGRSTQRYISRKTQTNMQTSKKKYYTQRQTSKINPNK